MDTIFPFGFPLPTAFYMVLYVVTLVIHVVFMNYVLAGSTYLAFVSLFPGGPEVQRNRGLAADVLRDWMPFAISAAITAGVAPLLFVQILYKQNYYTANLLLFHRWMSILPVLIVAAYLAYLLKSRWLSNAGAGWRTLVGVGMFACFLYTAWAWTENHLLSTAGQGVWSQFYADGLMRYRSPEIVPRLGVWYIGAFPTMALLVAWQLWTAGLRGTPAPAREHRRLARWAMLGLLGAGAIVAGWLYAGGGRLVAGSQAAMVGPFAIVAVLGGAVQAAAWLMQWRGDRLDGRWLTLASVGAVLALLGATVVREGIRLSSVDISQLYPQHAQASRVGGLVVFLLFFAINAVLCGMCFRIVRRGAAHSAPAPSR